MAYRVKAQTFSYTVLFVFQRLGLFNMYKCESLVVKSWFEVSKKCQILDKNGHFTFYNYHKDKVQSESNIYLIMLSKFYLNEIFNSDRTKMATLDIKIQVVNYLPGNVKQIFSELYIIIPMIALVNDLPYYNLW